MNSKSKLAKNIQSQNDALEFQQSFNVLEDLVDSIESMDISEEVDPNTSSEYLFLKAYFYQYIFKFNNFEETCV